MQIAFKLQYIVDRYCIMLAFHFSLEYQEATDSLTLFTGCAVKGVCNSPLYPPE